MDSSKSITMQDLQTGAAEDGDCRNPMDEKPDWLDMEKFWRGQRFCQKHIISLTLSWHFQLVRGFAIVNLLMPLVFTKNSDTPEKSLKRYAHTAYHMIQWLTNPSIWDGKFSQGFRSIAAVRKMHGNVAKAMNKKLGDNIYMTQYDMGLVQSGFMGGIVMYPEMFGLQCSKDDLEDFIHLWRGLGYLLGIDDKYNICSGNYQQTYNINKELEEQLIFPSLENPPKDFDKMCTAYIDGMNLYMGIQATSRESISALAYEAVSLAFRHYFLNLHCIPILNLSLSFDYER